MIASAKYNTIPSEDEDEVSGSLDSSMTGFLKKTSFLGMKLALLVGVVFLMFSVTNNNSHGNSLRSEKAVVPALSASEQAALVEKYGSIATYMGVAAGFSAISGTSYVQIMSYSSTYSTTIKGQLAAYTVVKAANSVYFNLAYSSIYGGSAAATYIAAVSTARTTVMAMTATTTLSATTMAAGGLTLTPGVYTIPAGSTFSGTTTLNCQSASTCEFFFQSSGSVIFNYGSTVAYSNYVGTPVAIWAVSSASIYGTMVGTVLASGSINAGGLSSSSYATTGPLLSTGGYVSIGMYSTVGSS